MKKLLSLESHSSNVEHEVTYQELRELEQEEKNTDIEVDKLVELTDVAKEARAILKDTQDGLLHEDLSTQSYKVSIAVEALKGSIKSKFPDVYKEVGIKSCSFESLTSQPRTVLVASQEGVLDVLKTIGKKIKEFIKMLIDKIKKLFSVIINVFKKSEKDIKEQEKNLGRGKFDVRDPGVMEKNTKFYSKKEVVEVVESQDERLSGLNDVVKEFAGEVKDDLTLDALVKVVKDIILRPEGDADDLKAEIIAYINANLTDKKLQERRNTVIDIDQIYEEIEFFSKRSNDVTRINNGRNKRDIGEIANSSYDEEELRTKFKYSISCIERAKANFNFYIEVLSGKDTRGIKGQDITLISPQWGRYNNGNDPVGELALCPIDTGESESYFDSWYTMSVEKNPKPMASTTTWNIIGEQVRKLEDPSGISSDAYMRLFGGGLLNDEKGPAIYMVSTALFTMSSLAKSIIEKHSFLEAQTKKTLDEFHNENFNNVTWTSLSYYGDPLGKGQKPGSHATPEMFENIKMLCKVYYNMTKYFLKVPITVKKAIDYYRSVVNSELFVKVKD